MNNLSEKTWVPLSLVSGLILSIVGGSMFITTMYNQGNANAQNIDSIRSDQNRFQEKISNKLDSMAEDIAVIKSKLK